MSIQKEKDFTKESIYSQDNINQSSRDYSRDIDISGRISQNFNSNTKMTREEKLREWKRQKKRNDSRKELTPKMSSKQKIKFEDTLRKYPVRDSSGKKVNEKVFFWLLNNKI